MPYYVYLVKCADNSYYCGYTTDLDRRILEHNSNTKAAKYTKTKRPVFLHYYEKLETLSQALKREHAIKKLTHAQKAILNTHATIR